MSCCCCTCNISGKYIEVQAKTAAMGHNLKKNHKLCRQVSLWAFYSKKSESTFLGLYSTLFCVLIICNRGFPLLWSTAALEDLFQTFSRCLWCNVISHTGTQYLLCSFKSLFLLFLICDKFKAKGKLNFWHKTSVLKKEVKVASPKKYKNKISVIKMMSFNRRTSAKCGNRNKRLLVEPYQNVLRLNKSKSVSLW